MDKNSSKTETTGGQWARLNILITPEQHKWLYDESWRTGQSMAEIVRQLIEAKRVNI